MPQERFPGFEHMAFALCLADAFENYRKESGDFGRPKRPASRHAWGKVVEFLRQFQDRRLDERKVDNLVDRQAADHVAKAHIQAGNVDHQIRHVDDLIFDKLA